MKLHTVSISELDTLWFSMKCFIGKNGNIFDSLSYENIVINNNKVKKIK